MKARVQEPRIAYLIKRVERALRLRMDEALKPHGMTTPEYTALSVLRGRDGLSSAQLARRTLVTAQAMNLVVIQLERRGFISRRVDPARARVQRISLTREGTHKLDACDQATLAIEEQLLARLTRGEVYEFRSCLDRCIEALDASRPTVALKRPAKVTF
jgi:DNA-binding MarR family transcriptional regulator